MTQEEAQYRLRILEYGKWLNAALAFPPKSIIQRSVRSLDQLCFLLEPSANSYPSVQLEALIQWVREDLEDVDLAEKIDAIVLTQSSYIDKCLAIYKVATERRKYLESLAKGECNVVC